MQLHRRVPKILMIKSRQYIHYYMKKVILILGILVACSCAKETMEGIGHNDDLVTFEENSSSQFAITDGQTILGEQIQIPYTVTNLLKALALLPAETRSQINSDEIYATHYYVKFHPKNKEELDLLEDIKPRLLLSETPLDREILVGGRSYHDPTLPEDVPTYQYTTIEARYWKELTDTLSVESEVLLEAYMPDYYMETETKSFNSTIPSSAMEALMQKAYELAGHIYEPMTKASEWYPSGTIKAYDNKTNTLVPIKGVRVRGTRFLTIKEDLTDDNGYYQLGSFKNQVNMKLIWEGENWDVRDGNLGQAVFDGPEVENTRWNVNIDSTQTAQIAFAAIHRAAYRYYCDYIFGLSRPDNSRREKLAYIEDGIHDGTVNGDYNQQWGLGVWSDIRIAGQNSSGVRDVSELFCTTCHELAHASHYTNAKNNYKDSELRVLESWTRFAQYLLTKQEYKELGVTSLTELTTQNGITGDKPDAVYNFQLNNSLSLTYTPVLVDLYDDFNQYLYYSNNPSYSDDKIKNIPPAAIENVVFNSTSFTNFIDKLKDLTEKYSGEYYNLTEENIDLLFDKYM